MPRIIFSPECDAAAAALEGYERIDRSLDAMWEALSRNPEGFDLIDVDEFSTRYVITTKMHGVPALVWLFSIEESGDIIFTHVETYQGY